MKKTTDGYRAHQLEHLVAPGGRGEYLDDKLYVIDGFAGFHRRLAAARAADSPVVGQQQAFFQGTMVWLVQADDKLHFELQQAGLLWDYGLKLPGSPPACEMPATPAHAGFPDSFHLAVRAEVSVEAQPLAPPSANGHAASDDADPVKESRPEPALSDDAAAPPAEVPATTAGDDPPF